MNIKRLRILDELLTEIMNHWLLYPLLLVTMGISREMTDVGDPGLPLWFFCGLLPPAFFILRCKVKKLIPFVFLHLVIVAAVALIPFSFLLNRVICIFCAAGYAVHSLVQRLKHDSLYTDVIQLPVAVALSAISALLQRYQGTRGWDNYYLIPLIGGIALYFIIYYIEHYLDFLAMNDSSAGFLPAKEMFHSGMGLVLVYTVLGTIVLLLGSQFEWLAGILEPVKNLFLRFLRFLFSRQGSTEPEPEIPVEESVATDSMGGMPLPEGGEPFWLWTVLETLLIIAFYCGILFGVIMLLWKLIQLIRKYRNLHYSERGEMQTQDAFDLRESCELEKKTGKSRQSIFSVLSPRERVRRLYKKKVLLSSSSLPEEAKSRLELYTAREWEEKLETEGMARIYEQARYSGHEITGADVKKMKEACKGK